MKVSGAEIIIKMLEDQGITRVAGIPGGSNLPLYDALGKSNIEHILVRQEQAAGFIAQGITRSTGKPAVCLATSGPGVTNLLTAIADAKLDSIPIIAITGQVASSLIGTDAFQEIDTYGLSIPITKHNFQVRSAEELLQVIPEAFQIAMSNRQGPVLIDVPKDVQFSIVEMDQWPESTVICENNEMLDMQKIAVMADMINASDRPILLIGGGIIQGQASFELGQLASKGLLPVIATLMGLDVLPSETPLFLGMLGMHGAPYNNYLLNEADLIIVLGMRFDDRATGRLDQFCPQAKIIHADIDAAELGKLKPADLAYHGDIKPMLENLIPRIENKSRRAWHEAIQYKKISHPMTISDQQIHPYTIFEKINLLKTEDTIITTDVGQHQMWAAQYLKFYHPRTFLTSGGLGTMGFGLPAAIGAALANPDKPVVCISGDGSILMNIQELATLSELHLNIKLLIMKNGYLGMIRQQQDLFFKQQYFSAKFRRNPDFIQIARGFGLAAYDWEFLLQDPDRMQALWQSKTPCVIEVRIAEEENVMPTVAPGNANIEMIGG